MYIKVIVRDLRLTVFVTQFMKYVTFLYNRLTNYKSQIIVIKKINEKTN